MEMHGQVSQPHFGQVWGNNPAGVVERRMIAPSAIEGKMARSCESTAAAADMGNYNSSRRPMIRTDSTPFSLRERLLQALRYIGRSRPDALVQVWMPVTQGNNKLFLTTRDQPYVLERKNDQLWSFRSVSENSAEYLRVEEAQRYDVRGTVSVPVLNPVSRTCLAVIELVTKTERVQYRPEIDIICRALQVGTHCVPYRISDDHHPVSVMMWSQSRQAVLAEIAEVLTAVCETHKLPIAQTWVPASQYNSSAANVLVHNGSKRVRFDIDDGCNCYNTCLSSRKSMSLRTGDGPCYVSDGRMWGFRRACLEHAMEKGQGVPGKAFASNRPFFDKDVKSYSKTEYPLGHYSKWFGLSAAVAIRLRSIHTGSDDFILEFFLPPSCVESQEQQLMLNSLSITMQRICRSLRTVTDKELEEEKEAAAATAALAAAHADAECKSLKLLEAKEEKDLDCVPPGHCGFGPPTPVMTHEVKSQCLLDHQQHQQRKSYLQQQQHPLQYNQPADQHINNTGEVDDSIQHQHPSSRLQHVQLSCQTSDELSLDLGAGGTSMGRELASVACSGQDTALHRRRADRRRGTTEKTIGLGVLQQYFAGSLKDAAKSIGVCPTTLKRICRQHGISRWPSRKINKVSRSLKKLQGVIDSVQGADGALRINTLTGNIASVAAAAVTGIHIGKDGPPPSQGSWSVSWATHAPINRDCKEHLVTSKGPAADLLAIPKEEDNKKPTVRSAEEDAIGGLANEGNLMTSADDASHGISDCSSPSSVGGTSQKMIWPPRSDSTSAITIKATVGTDTVRFKFPLGAGYLDLREEVRRRVKVEGHSFDLKYLDDDEEWMLLACEADLQECLEVTRVSQRHAIKLMVRCSSGSRSSASLGSNAPQ
ncbi:unnamed protein product [Sphagnum balticum]